MIRKQISEKIFLQPIDQHYDIKGIGYDDQLKFFEEYEHNTVDYLNLSTDSDTLSRRDSIDEIEPTLRIDSILKSNWTSSIDCLKNNHLNYFNNFILTKMAYMRNTLNMNNSNFNNRTYSCPGLLSNYDGISVSPFISRKSSDISGNEVIEKKIPNFFDENQLN